MTTQASTTDRVRIGKIWIDAVTFQEALQAIEGMVRTGGGGSVFTPNVDHVVTAEDDPAFHAAYEAVSLSLADGMPLVWAATILGTPLPEKVSGSDLVEPLLRRAGEMGWRVFLLGGAPGVAEAAAERARRDFGVEEVFTASPTIRLDGSPGDLEGGIEEVVAARPDLVLAALGTPKQELWIEHNRKRVPSTVMLGVGAALDFLTGRVRRAPRWVSSAGLEWLYRLGHEPRRLSYRYLVKDPRILPIVIRSARSPRNSRVGTRP